MRKTVSLILTASFIVTAITGLLITADPHESGKHGLRPYTSSENSLILGLRSKG